MTRPTLTFEVEFTAGVWTDLNSTANGERLMALDTYRGRERQLQRWNAGELTAVLDNSDGQLDPAYTGGTYTSGGATLIRPMLRCRVQATFSATTYAVWLGYIDSWQVNWEDPEHSTATVTATDAFKRFAGQTRVAGSSVGASETSGARIGRILDGIGWSASDRDIDTGQSTMQATTLAGSVLQELQLVEASEFGAVYMGADGKVIFDERHAVYSGRMFTSQATFGDDTAYAELGYVAVATDYSDQLVYNQALITRAGGTTQQGDDTTTQADPPTGFGTRTFSATGLLLEDDLTAGDYADYIPLVYGRGEQRFTAITLHPDGDDTNLYPQVLGRLLRDRITVKRRPPGGHGVTITRDCLIESIAHRVRPLADGNGSWATVFGLGDATDIRAFILDDDTYGLLDQNYLIF